MNDSVIAHSAPKYPVLDELEVPESVLQNWQVTVDLLAEIANIPAALIMRVHKREIEVFMASHSLGNVYHPGEKAPLDTGLYCEMVMTTQRKLTVPNALKDPAWDHNPDIKLGMVAYCGLPLTWPTGEIFGTICVLDKRENTFNKRLQPVIERFRDSVQLSLAQIYEASLIRQQRDEIKRQLSESEIRSQRYLDTTQTMLVALNTNGSITMINQAGQALLGYTELELMGQNWFAKCLPQPQGMTAAYPQFQQMMAGEPEAFAGYEGELLVRNGGWCLVSCRNSLLRDDQGLITGVLISGADITERKWAEKALQRLNRELRTVSECNQILVRATNEEELLQEICRIICEHAGYRMAWVGMAENDTDKSMRPVAWAGDEEGYLSKASISWADTERDRGPTGVSIRTGQTVYIQDVSTDPRMARWRMEALKRGYHSSIALPLKDKEGQPFGALTIYSAETNAFNADEIHLLEELAADLAYGITYLRARIAHAQVAAALQESETELRMILDSMHTGLLIIDADTHTIVEVNPLAAKLVGEPKEKIVGRVCHNFVCPAEKGRCPVTDLGQTVDNSERVLLKADGTKLPIIKTVGPFTLRGRRYLVESFVDITERKQAEAEHQRLATAMEQAAEAIVITDAQANILYVNPAFGKITGYTRPEALGQNPRILKSGRQDAAFYKHMWDTLTRGEVWHGHFVNKRKDGSLYEEEATISPIRDAAGTITNYVAIKLDVSHEVELEQRIRQAQKMEAVGRLAGGVAHDFNNILQAIFGFCGILLDGMPETETLRRDVDEIKNAADRAAGLTRQLLAFSRRQMIAPIVMDLNAVIANTKKMLQRMIGEDIEVITQLAPDLRRVKADPGNMAQILMNLAVNARDAMPQGGRITIGTANIALNEDSAGAIPYARLGAFVCLSVTDTGCGMSKEILQHIFEPFFSTKGPDKGTGLGLSVIYGIARQHEGWVNVYSEVGHGTTFKVYLPVYAGETAGLPLLPVREQEPSPRGHGERILVIEDDPTVCRIVQRVLKDAGYEVHFAASAASARQLFAKEDGRFDLLFSDVVLPDGNGFDLAEEFRARDPLLAVLLSSGYTDERVRWGDPKAQGFHFIQKPYVAGDLLRTIHEILENNPRPA